MLKRSCSGVVLLVLSGTVLITSTACSRNTTVNTVTKSVETTPVTSTVPPAIDPVAVAPALQPTTPFKQADSYKDALEKAESAGSITVSAQSQDDWNLVVSRWQQAIQLMRSVPKSSPYGTLAASKLLDYQRKLAYAKKQASRAASGEIAFDPGALPVAPTYSASDNEPVNVIADASPSSGRVYRARIKRRAGGTPVIDVTFNGSRTFEMIVDTGASGTVITEEMAAALKVSVVGKAKVNTASAKNVEVPLAYLNSIAIGGAVVKGVVVAIGNSALDIGLLGHDFFSDYDVTVKRNVVEFRAR